jgi:Lysozyme like domain
MNRLLAFGIAVALAVALPSQGLPTAEAADKEKSPKKGGASSDQAQTMTAIALAESKRKKGLKTTLPKSKAGGGGEDSKGLWQINSKAPKGGKGVKSN